MLLHRSILTHSALLPLFLFVLLRPVLFRRSLGIAGRLFLIGLCFSLAIHLCFDMYPTRWWGFALIRSMGEFLISLLGLIVLYGMAAAREPQASFYVLAWVLPISFFVFVLSRHRNDPDDPAARLRHLIRKL